MIEGDFLFGSGIYK